LEANGRFAPPVPTPAPSVSVPATSDVSEPATAAPVETPKPTEANFFAALPLAVEASITELPVEKTSADDLATPALHVEASVDDDAVAPAPVDDPFLASLFAAPEQTVHPEAIPMVDGPVRGSSWVKRPKLRRAKAERPAVVRVKKRSSKSRADVAAKTRRKSRPASTLLSIGAMLFSGALLVGTTVPANAFMTFAAEDVNGTTVVMADAGEAQKVAVSADTSIGSLARDAFEVTSYAEVLTAKYGTRIYSFTPTAGDIRWPFPYATPISSGYGDRIAPCRGCSSHHNGVDFTPGAGTPIYAIADGVVTESKYGGSFGQHVYMSHVIDGKQVDSIYGHMIQGSSPLSVGDAVKVGDLIGLVGTTGASTGNHLHLEIHLDGVPVDPFAWLQANAR
jgi:murein DD-endopeptidase MepM/ murein hydrolase activator NlpD